MARRRKKKSAVRLAYEKERRRIQNYLSRKQREGFLVDIEVKPVPPRVTQKMLRDIKAVKPKVLQQYIRKVDAETGEIFEYADVQEQLREQSRVLREEQKRLLEEQRKAGEEIPTFTDIVLENFFYYINGFPRRISERIKAFINKLILEQGRDETAQALQDMPNQFLDYLEMYKGDSEQAVSAFCTDLLTYLPDASEWWVKEAVDDIESGEMWENM